MFVFTVRDSYLFIFLKRKKRFS